MCEKRARKNCFVFHFLIFWTAFVAYPQELFSCMPILNWEWPPAYPTVYPAFPVPAALSCQKKMIFWNVHFSRFISSSISILQMANVIKLILFALFFLSFGPLNLMLCILDCCYWWKHQTRVEYFSVPNKCVGWNKRNCGKICSCTNVKNACWCKNFWNTRWKINVGGFFFSQNE